jgi:ribosomal protein S18 acetylase RimI-like enzyme
MWVRAAHGDAWQALGIAGAAEVPGVRLMATGLPHPQWNSGDVDEPALVDLDTVRDWYAIRGLPWGLRVPAGVVWPYGCKLVTRRLMGLTSSRFRAAAPVEGVAIRIATPADLPAVLRIDTIAFEESTELERGWLELLLAHPAVTVALAYRDGEPVATGYLTLSSGRAGPAAYLGGIAVMPTARRQGVGAAVSSWLIERGHDAAAALWHLHPDHDGAASMYRQLGFVEVEGLDIYLDMDRPPS